MTDPGTAKTWFRAIGNLRTTNVATLIWQAFANPLLVFALLPVVAAVIVATAPAAPSVVIPINVPRDWASWFDAYITLPVMTVVLLWMFRGLRKDSAFLFGAVVSLPAAYEILQSYYWFYDAGAYSSLTYWVQLATSVLMGAIIALLALNLLRGPGKLVLRGGVEVSQWIPAAVCLAAGLTALQLLLRTLLGPIPQLNLFSDIGVTLSNGGADLLAGINPYSHVVSPFGGTAQLPYGPLAFGLMIPFVAVSQTWAPLTSSIFFAAATAAGVYRVVRPVSRSSAISAAATFLLVPCVAMSVAVGATLELISSTFIVWGLYFGLRRRPALSGLTLALGTVATIYPGFLILPFLLYRRGGSRRMFLAFATPLALGVMGAVAIAPSLLTDQLSNLIQLGASASRYAGPFTPTGAVVLTWMALFSLLLFSALIMWDYGGSAKALILVSAFLMAGVPIITGYYFFSYTAYVAPMVIIAVFLYSSPSSTPPVPRGSVAVNVNESDSARSPADNDSPARYVANRIDAVPVKT
jgi:hypothetical protein